MKKAPQWRKVSSFVIWTILPIALALPICSSIRCNAQSQVRQSSKQRKAVATLTDEQRTSLLNEIESRDRAAWESRRRFYFQPALEEFKAQLTAEESLYGADDWRCASTRRYIADVTLECELTDEEVSSLQQFQQANGRIKEARARSDHASVIRISPQAIVLIDALFGQNHFLCLDTRNRLANAYVGIGDAASAYPLLTSSLAMAEEQFPHDHPMRLLVLVKLAVVEKWLGKNSQALDHLRTAARDCSHVDAEFLRDYLGLHCELASHAYNEADWSSAMKHCEHALDTLGQFDSASYAAQLIEILVLKSEIAQRQGKHEVSYRLLRECDRAAQPSSYAMLRPSISRAMMALLTDIGANELAQRELKLAETGMPSDRSGVDAFVWATLRSQSGWLALSMGDFALAAREFQEARNAVTSPDQPFAEFRAIDSELGLAWALVELGRTDEAESLLAARAVVGERSLAFESGEELRRLILANLYAKAQRFKEAKELASIELVALRRRYGQEQPEIAPFLALQAKVLRACGDAKRAKEMDASVDRIHQKCRSIRSRLVEVASEEDAKDEASLRAASRRQKR